MLNSKDKMLITIWKLKGILEVNQDKNTQSRQTLSFCIYDPNWHILFITKCLKSVKALLLSYYKFPATTSNTVFQHSNL